MCTNPLDSSLTFPVSDTQMWLCHLYKQSEELVLTVLLLLGDASRILTNQLLLAKRFFIFTEHTK